MTFWLAVVGCRDWQNDRMICDYLDARARHSLGIVTGSDVQRSGPYARTGGNVDRFASMWATSKGVPLIEHPPDYETRGKLAPLYRNLLIVEQAHALVAFWDGRSRGTASSLRIAWNTYLPIRVFFPDGRSTTCQRDGR